MDRDSGQVVSILAFYSFNSSSNLAEAYSFSVKFVFENNKNKLKKEVVVLKKTYKT